MRATAQPGDHQVRETKKLRPHPQADRVPQVSETEEAAFNADVGERGIVVPLEITRDNIVVDGHRRLRGALASSLRHVPVRVVEPAEPLVAYMLAAALHRRHLTPSQRAILALELDAYQQQRAHAGERKRANLRHATVDVAALPPRGRSRDLAASLAGVSPRLIQNAITIRDQAPELYGQAKTGELTLQRALDQLQRNNNYAQAGETPPLPEDPFGVIYGDPPWPSPSPGGKWAPEQHYRTVEVPEIKLFQVPAAENAVLFLWAVTALLPEALEVMKAWGFEYRSNMIWDKLSIGLGVWVRHEHEQLLIGRRGNYPPPTPTRRVRSIVRARRGRHSEKPKVFYELIEQMYPNAKRLELFARGKPRPGWTAWGNQVEESDEAAA
jgi:N6-adenosine-specific RNA methylase IME4/ParB-like chromosome segregation protein Spo0J